MCASHQFPNDTDLIFPTNEILFYSSVVSRGNHPHDASLEILGYAPPSAAAFVARCFSQAACDMPLECDCLYTHLYRILTSQPQVVPVS